MSRTVDGNAAPFPARETRGVSSDAVGSAPIFCVGQIRTGTTTFGDACEILGFTRRGWGMRARHGLLVNGWLGGDVDLLCEKARAYDVLEDLPWPLVYKEMSECFPDAKFVLTTRKSTRRWFRSVVRHTRASEPYWVHRTIFGDELAENDPKGYKSVYRNHIRDVREFFAGSDRFLDVCWERGDGWAELCSFLDVPVPDVSFPHANASQKRLRQALARPARAVHRQ